MQQRIHQTSSKLFWVIKQVKTKTKYVLYHVRLGTVVKVVVVKNIILVIKNRTGLLCGQCRNGSSENLINSACINPNECDDFLVLDSIPTFWSYLYSVFYVS